MDTLSEKSLLARLPRYRAETLVIALLSHANILHSSNAFFHTVRRYLEIQNHTDRMFRPCFGLCMGRVFER